MVDLSNYASSVPGELMSTEVDVRRSSSVAEDLITAYILDNCGHLPGLQFEIMLAPVANPGGPVQIGALIQLYQPVPLNPGTHFTVSQEVPTVQVLVDADNVRQILFNMVTNLQSAKQAYYAAPKQV